jgi:prophage regulatory protein
MAHNILRIRQVMAKTGLARSTIYFLIALNKFPRPVRLGERAVGWLESSIDAWIQRRLDDGSSSDTGGAA